MRRDRQDLLECCRAPENRVECRPEDRRQQQRHESETGRSVTQTSDTIGYRTARTPATTPPSACGGAPAVRATPCGASHSTDLGVEHGLACPLSVDLRNAAAANRRCTIVDSKAGCRTDAGSTATTRWDVALGDVIIPTGPRHQSWAAAGCSCGGFRHVGGSSRGEIAVADTDPRQL